MVYMMHACEQRGEQNGEEFKLMNAFPLRTAMTPMHIRLDATSVINSLCQTKKPLKDRQTEDNITLDEAQAHCSDPDTQKKGQWFDGYNKE